jgi:hypothetical protein
MLCFVATQPGFVSVNLHRSKDGSHLVNYIQLGTILPICWMIRGVRKLPLNASQGSNGRSGLH